MKYTWTQREAWGKGTAAGIGGLLLFVASTLFTGVVLPTLGLGLSLSVALGVVLCVPTWVAAMVGALLAKSALRAWLVVGGATLLLGGAVTLVLTLHPAA